MATIKRGEREREDTVLFQKHGIPGVRLNSESTSNLEPQLPKLPFKNKKEGGGSERRKKEEEVRNENCWLTTALCGPSQQQTRKQENEILPLPLLKGATKGFVFNFGLEDLLIQRIVSSEIIRAFLPPPFPKFFFFVWDACFLSSIFFLKAT